MNTQIDTTQPATDHTPVPLQLLSATRSTCNESNSKGMAGCLADSGVVLCYFPTESSFDRFGPLAAAAPELLEALENAGNVLAALATGQLKQIKPDSAALAQIRAAIAKAKGAA